MFRNLLLCFFISVFTFSVSAQEIKSDLEKLETTVSGDSLLVTGFKPKTESQKFVVSLYNRSTLALIGTYEKNIDPGAKRYFVEKVGDTYRFTFYSSADVVKYRISTDLSLKELFAGVPVEKASGTNEEVSSEWTYASNYCNDYVYGNYMLDPQLTTLTCYTLLDPLEGNYTKKWEHTFNENYDEVEILGVNGTTVYLSLISIRLSVLQKIMAIDLVTGTEYFTQQLNLQVKTDSVKCFGVSNFYCSGNSVFLAGTYLIDDPGTINPVAKVADERSRNHGYDNLDYYGMYMADGYFLMSLDAKSGSINNFRLFLSPSIDKDVDNRDFRAAVCPGIAPLKNGKFVALFEQFSCITHISFNSNAPNNSRNSIDEGNPDYVKWTLDAFTSVVFNDDLSDCTNTTTIYEEDNTTYTLSDFDMFALNVQSELPHDYTTFGYDGADDAHQFICDGTNWTFIIRADDEKSPDYLLKGNENEQKIVKLINSGILYPIDPGTMVERKEGETSTTIKIVKH